MNAIIILAACYTSVGIVLVASFAFLMVDERVEAEVKRRGHEEMLTHMRSSMFFVSVLITLLWFPMTFEFIFRNGKTTNQGDPS